MNESQILADVLLALGSRSDVRCWRNNAGVARDARTGQHVRFGVRGQGDISGILRGGQPGRRLEVEVKSATGRQSHEQRAFQAMIESFGGVYILARSAADAVAQLEARL